MLSLSSMHGQSLDIGLCGGGDGATLGTRTTPGGDQTHIIQPGTARRAGPHSGYPARQRFIDIAQP